LLLLLLLLSLFAAAMASVKPPRERSVEDSSTSASKALLLLSAIAGLGLYHLLQLDGIQQELRILLAGLAATLTGSAEAKQALPHDKPEFGRDVSVFGVLAIVMFFINWGVRLALVEPLVLQALNFKKSQLVKVSQSVMEVGFYGGFAIIGLAIVPSQTWIWPSKNWWIDNQTGSHLSMRSDLRCYYIMYCSRYFQAAVSVLLESKRKDFAEMMLHHVVTIGVVYVSYFGGYNRVGVVVMALLDPADVPLHLAKLCKYTAETTKRGIWQFVADRLFELFAVMFFISRLVMYSYVCWSSHIEHQAYGEHTFTSYSCITLLYTLLALQMYWFGLIIKVAVKLARGQPGEDPRSEDEAEADESPRKKLQ